MLRRLLFKLTTDRRYRRYLLDARQRERLFVWTILRTALAYRTGSLRYGVLGGRGLIGALKFRCDSASADDNIAWKLRVTLELDLCLET